MLLQVPSAPTSHALLIDLMLHATLHVLEHAHARTHARTCIMNEYMNILWMIVHLFDKLIAVLRGHTSWPAFCFQGAFTCVVSFSCHVD